MRDVARLPRLAQDPALGAQPLAKFGFAQYLSQLITLVSSPDWSHRVLRSQLQKLTSCGGVLMVCVYTMAMV